ncbi:L,D-transpeptidase [Prochlorothrix hollandica]|uniref:L,D-transpeptidase n=1 Tax=Prochlorothrix hollandica TaxID=1223 RepID=UPI00034CF90A|nr:L,D-transpeptidase [Prochlorothrix hollandica]
MDFEDDEQLSSIQPTTWLNLAERLLELQKAVYLDFIPGSLPLLPYDRFVPEVESSEVKLVLDLSDRYVYVYVSDQLVEQYRVVVGKPGWDTPIGDFSIIKLQTNPTWRNPWTQELVPSGGLNPLGVAWISFWSDGYTEIGFHGTPYPELLGQAVSHGCVRMHNDDISELFQKVQLGTPVQVIP